MDTKKQGRQPTQGQAPSSFDDEAKLKSAAGQTWDSERMDRISDQDLENLQLDQEIRQQAGEQKGRRRAPVSDTRTSRRGER
jgi:hypothetical protein